jgi:hypothetical protein
MIARLPLPKQSNHYMLLINSARYYDSAVTYYTTICSQFNSAQITKIQTHLLWPNNAQLVIVPIKQDRTKSGFSCN